VVDIAPVSYTHCFNNLIQALKALPLHEISNRKQAELLLLRPYLSSVFASFVANLVLKNGAYCWRIDLDVFYRTAPILCLSRVENITPYTGKRCFWRVKIPLC